MIKLANHYEEKLELENAVILYDEGLRRNPNDTLILDAYADFLL